MSTRLDRCLCLEGWRLAFPLAKVCHPPKLNSYHIPLILYCRGAGRITASPFRFQVACLAHQKFSSIIKDGWKSDFSLLDNLKQTQHTLSHWNRMEFGNIFQNKRRLIRKIEGVQKCLAIRRSRNLIKLEYKLKCQLEEVLKQEELHWSQCSKEEWIVSEARKTSFYHLAAMIRSKKERVVKLKNSYADWVDDEGSLKNMAREYFQALYTSDSVADCSAIPCSHGLVLSSKQRLRLDRQYMKDEVEDGSDIFAAASIRKLCPFFVYYLYFTCNLSMAW
uniref:Uncharacterized protein n=1 Tax=Manihot esculenta TaxID=3983 RepID=A0A2C9VZV8_MANES